MGEGLEEEVGDQCDPRGKWYMEGAWSMCTASFLKVRTENSGAASGTEAVGSCLSQALQPFRKKAVLIVFKSLDLL